MLGFRSELIASMKAPARLSNNIATSLHRSRLSHTATLQASVPSRKPPLEVKKFNFTSRHGQSFRLFTSTALASHSSLSSQTSSQTAMENVLSTVTPKLLVEIRDFWFEHLSRPDSLIFHSVEEAQRWYSGGEAFDKLCVERYAPTLEALRTSGITSGKDIINALQPSDACDWLSLIILLDQIPRNCYRGESASIVFKFFDPLAREISLAAIERGIPDEWPEMRWRFSYRSWFYLPLEHSEDRETHEIALREYEGLVEDIEALIQAGDSTEEQGGNEYRMNALRAVRERPDAARAFGQLNLGFEKRHQDIIKRFGRYPHRNKAMGREYTAEEREYLQNGGDTFGG